MSREQLWNDTEVESYKKLRALINPPPSLILASDIVLNKTIICVSV